MKIKKCLVYGIILLVILASFVACGNKDIVDEGNKATPESLVLAYINGFLEKDFTQIASKYEESADLGDLYFTESQEAPKETLAILESQHEFITHFYGDDAWSNVDYYLEEIALEGENLPASDNDVENDSDVDSETDGIKEYKANFIFNETPLHLLGYENIHIVVSNESGDWMIKEGLSWDVNLYGGGPTPSYFQGYEASYRTIDRDHHLEDVSYVLGETMNREESQEDDYYSLELRYGDATYYFFGFADEEGYLTDGYTLDGITVQGGDYKMLRDIKLGDSFYDTMSKFPRERDWLSDPDNLFYGTGVGETNDSVFGGACYSWVEDDGTRHDNIMVKDEDSVATVRLEFENGILNLMEIWYISFL